ncbi:alcohol dehydrogenase [Comamonas testosteroni]|uniref:Alcohol dehydrogenase n=2 Tax=Comamonas testosteroni TaxID=285 RepID=A0A5A7MC10_COMTE|nr:alcohol dehydrogenase [Comamonas testosteroni]
MQEILDCLRSAEVEVLVSTHTLPELPGHSITTCVDFAQAFKPEVVIGLGGGSCMDMAKLVSLVLTHGGPPSQYYGELKVPGPILPVIAITTTAGTGSEVTPVAVMADDGRDLKVGISSPHLIPHTAICDPELTWSCPPQLTALSGADALTHAIEAFTAVKHTPTPQLALQRVFVGKNDFSDVSALTAIRALAKYLPRAVRDGNDKEARSQVMFGSLCAGMAFGVAGTAAAHAIQYPVGALTHTAHGLGVASLLPYVMAYNAAHCMPEMAEIARALGSEKTEMRALAEDGLHRLREFLADIGIPRTLAELGLTKERLDWVAEQSMLSSRLINNNPRPLSTSDVRAIVADAYYGEIRPINA